MTTSCLFSSFATRGIPTPPGRAEAGGCQGRPPCSGSWGWRVSPWRHTDFPRSVLGIWRCSTSPPRGWAFWLRSNMITKIGISCHGNVSGRSPVSRRKTGQSHPGRRWSLLRGEGSRPQVLPAAPWCPARREDHVFLVTMSHFRVV